MTLLFGTKRLRNFTAECDALCFYDLSVLTDKAYAVDNGSPLSGKGKIICYNIIIKREDIVTYVPTVEGVTLLFGIKRLRNFTAECDALRCYELSVLTDKAYAVGNRSPLSGKSQILGYNVAYE